jgi:hypothetical protein
MFYQSFFLVLDRFLSEEKINEILRLHQEPGNEPSCTDFHRFFSEELMNDKSPGSIGAEFWDLVETSVEATVKASLETKKKSSPDTKEKSSQETKEASSPETKEKSSQETKETSSLETEKKDSLEPASELSVETSPETSSKTGPSSSNTHWDYSANIRDAFKRLRDRLQRRHLFKSFVFVIDEARYLIEGDVKVFRNWRRAIAVIDRSLPFFFLLIDTAGKIANFTPSREKDPSKKVQSGGHHLFPPKYLIPFVDIVKLNKDPSQNIEAIVDKEDTRKYVPFKFNPLVVLEKTRPIYSL